jgi:hypothetical protein
MQRGPVASRQGAGEPPLPFAGLAAGFFVPAGRFPFAGFCPAAFFRPPFGPWWKPFVMLSSP